LDFATVQTGQRAQYLGSLDLRAPLAAKSRVLLVAGPASSLLTWPGEVFEVRENEKKRTKWTWLDLGAIQTGETKKIQTGELRGVVLIHTM
jgi:hypothetical protein